MIQPSPPAYLFKKTFKKKHLWINPYTLQPIQTQVSLAVLPVVHAIGCLGTAPAGRFHGAAGRQFVGAHLARQAPAVVHVAEDEVALRVVEPLADAQHVLTLQAVRLVVQPLGHALVAAPESVEDY